MPRPPPLLTLFREEGRVGYSVTAHRLQGHALRLGLIKVVEMLYLTIYLVHDRLVSRPRGGECRLDRMARVGGGTGLKEKI